MKIAIEDVNFDAAGLIPVVVQDARTRRVLTLAFMNAESLRKTLDTRETWFWSRSRSSLWHKGETSGNTQRVVDVLLDCDRDALTVLVVPSGPACHTGSESCFHNELQDAGPFEDVPVAGSTNLAEVLDSLYALVESRKRERPEGSYTTYLFDQGLDKILKKVGEESAETIIAAKNDDRNALVKESSDLLYHLVVLLVERGLSLGEVRDELVSRGKKEKAIN
ncbi:MAG TPA: bifunctional phosphoribosyl-AMP cyclohydrolase/phosphoribosyl-ATP pyrophosphatase [Blastocatellia bacterium]|jgi:phosphoribosyl-ATP pyrophosphohydrolase/phosphoribosyl-AMP cyclohydrolase|nr:bifunctional phosphoribosyl-AMP cyclohydrolase/phosphoribosyl-ATP pyrophosphatase [Blastocatellia bacterium]HAF22724.1 bifunctional phosphoribosyl-AMP cyclohydrolase/phosphoribosyl-ATP pyrophosphatase [Blastocatellia bacterium]HCX29392.1 bifunctional phosphoribosyl-AMP cyclohydrolase/phosphoribosyl-ATP pyrophosphatase [Blastocatellia bacterium]